MHNIPTFPTFRRFMLEDKDWYNEFYAHYQPFADFSFGNLIMWLDQYDDLEIAQLYDNVILRCTNLFMDNKKMMTFLGDNAVSETAQAIFAFQAEQKETQEILGLPEFAVQALQDNDMFACINDRDNDEYILDTEFLSVGMSKHIRRKISAFQRDYGDVTEVRDFDLASTEDTAFLRQAVSTWSNAFTTNESAQQEEQVFLRMLEKGDHTGHKSFGVFVNDTLASVTVYQPVPQLEFIIANHMKANYSVTNVFIFTTHTLATRMKESGIKYMNYEQDLGLPGLRSYKEHLHPVYFLKKFTVRPK